MLDEYNENYNCPMFELPLINFKIIFIISWLKLLADIWSLITNILVMLLQILISTLSVWWSLTLHNAELSKITSQDRGTRHNPVILYSRVYIREHKFGNLFLDSLSALQCPRENFELLKVKVHNWKFIVLSDAKMKK